nr:LysR family transcriptional regulator [Actinocrinis puniceicyclus]
MLLQLINQSVNELLCALDDQRLGSLRRAERDHRRGLVRHERGGPPPFRARRRRTAGRPAVAESPIRHLERELGVRLLDRTPQGAVHTAAGEVFLPRAKALLKSAAQAAASATAADYRTSAT